MRTLVILLDTLRRDYLPCYGNTWVRAPNIQRLADRGTVCDNHYAGSLPCMPARREILTGRQNFLHTPWGGLEPYDDSLPALLRQHGVHSHICTDHYHYFHRGGENYVDEFSTWDFQRGQENDKWVSAVDQPALPEFAAPTKQNAQNWLNRERQRHEEDYSGPRTVMDAVRWLERNARQDQWFLQLELFDPHEPFMVPVEYLREYEDDWQGLPFDWPAYQECREAPDLIAHVRKRYAALLTMTDRWLGRVLDELERQGVFEDTLVILSTDHGTCLGEHGYWMKNHFPVYQQIAHIPLIVKQPGGTGGGGRTAALTQTHDLFRTVCKNHGVAPAPFAQGVAMQDALSGAASRTAALFGYFGMAANVTDGRHVYMRNPAAAANEPLFAYSALPCSPALVRRREAYAQVETGRWFRFAHDLPLYRFPVDKPGAGLSHLHADAGGAGRHQLYDIIADSDQAHPCSDPAVEERMAGHLRRLMQDAEAPPEQFQRLGLAG